ncbi:MAG: hypothetical protein K5922_00310 [Clostridiales bacterium]|nr:hypothetical protein [Clostridiales bacterium]
MKKLVSLLLAAMLVTLCVPSLAADAPEGYPAVVEGIDFGGATLYINPYWDPAVRSEDPTEDQELTYAFQDWIMETYNVKIVEEKFGDWGEPQVQEIRDFISKADANELRVFLMPPGFVGKPMVQGWFADWANNDLIDLKDDDLWNPGDVDFMTMGGKVYGVSTGKPEPRQCVFFNKRVLEEAGIDWNTIYDAQANGTWTWAMFEDMLKTLTRDTDNDGVNDIWGIIGSGDDMYNCAVFANGGCYFDFDADGKIYPAMGSDEAIQALTWGKEIQANYWAPTPEGANWDWYKEDWKKGYCGFYMYQTYGGFNDNSEMADMEDDWGCVAFPVPNEGDPYITVISDNITMIPACYDAETVAKLAFLYDLWSAPTPGYDDEDAWIGNKYNYTDERAVDETYAMLREPEHCRINKVTYLGTQNDILGSDFLWNLGAENTPEALIETNMDKWQSACDTFNAD